MSDDLEFKIKCSNRGGELRFSERNLRPDGTVHSYWLDLTTPEVTARAFVGIELEYSYGKARCVEREYFQDLSDSWAGWKVPKQFYSENFEFQIEALHDGKGNIEFRIEMHGYNYTVRTQFNLEAGALSKISSDANRFFAQTKID